MLSLFLIFIFFVDLFKLLLCNALFPFQKPCSPCLFHLNLALFNRFSVLPAKFFDSQLSFGDLESGSEDQAKVESEVKCDEAAGHVANSEFYLGVAEPATKAHDCVKSANKDHFIEQLHLMPCSILKRVDVRQNYD